MPVNVQKKSELIGEGGYALVALLGLLTVIAFLLTAAAPIMRQQSLRVREQEAIHRGEEVAEAILLYVRARKTLPTSMEQLLEGIPQGTKKVQVLRASSLRDPLSESGEWRLVRPNDAAFLEFTRAVTAYAGGPLPPPRDPALQPFAAQINSLVNTPSTQAASESASPELNDNSANSTGPFIGVRSRSQRASVIHYYGIDHHNKWIFTPLFRPTS